MQVVILCGGRGQRAYPLTEEVPKPMVAIGGRPILLHLMDIFADQGHTQFILSVGYRQEIIRDYFARPPAGWRVEIVDTGGSADTGDRVHGCRHLLDETFFLTYGDGLADVSLEALEALHVGRKSLATITTVPLSCQYGIVEADEAGQVLAFLEKPVLRDRWVSAGFMVMDRRVFDHWSGASLERDVLPHLARSGMVHAYRHDGFFKSLDSLKDQLEFEDLLQSAAPPWRRTPRLPP